MRTVVACLIAGLSLVPFSLAASRMEKRHFHPTDVEILNFALSLEHLENAFYTEALSRFSQGDFKAAGLPKWYRGGFEAIAEHEADHVAYLTGILGDQAIAPCQYSFPITDVESVLALSRIFEAVGTSAYLGASQFIHDKDNLLSAGSIMSVEARQSAWLFAITGVSPFPEDFTSPITFNDAQTLASGFIVPGSCPTDKPLPPGVHAYPALTVKTTDPKPGKRVGLHFPIPDGYDGPYWATMVFNLEVRYARINPHTGVFTLPTDLAGMVFLFVTKNKKPPCEGNIIAGPAPLIVP